MMFGYWLEIALLWWPRLLEEGSGGKCDEAFFSNWLRIRVKHYAKLKASSGSALVSKELHIGMGHDLAAWTVGPPSPWKMIWLLGSRSLERRGT